MKRTSAARCGSLASPRARLSTSVRDAPGAPSAPNATLWNSRTGSVRPPRVLKSRSSTSVFTSPGAAPSVVSSDAPSPDTMSASFSPPEPTCGEIVVEPVGERRVEVDDVAVGIDREEAGRRVVEIVDGVLQFLEDVFLPLAVARHVGDGPQRQAAVALPRRRAAARAAAASSPRSPFSPATRTSSCSAAALARRLEQAIDRLRHVGIADEHPLDRPHVVGVGGVDQVEIGGIGIDHPAARIGDQEAVDRLVDHRLEHRVAGVLAGDPQDAGRQREQREHADHGEDGEQRQDIGPGIAAADQQQADGGADQRERDQQHHADAAAARRVWLRSTAGARCPSLRSCVAMTSFCQFGVARRDATSVPWCLSRAVQRKRFRSASPAHRAGR